MDLTCFIIVLWFCLFPKYLYDISYIFKFICNKISILISKVALKIGSIAEISTQSSKRLQYSRGFVIKSPLALQKNTVAL